MLSDVRDFVTAIFADTGSGTCGSIAAGLVIASPFVEPDWAQTMFFAGSAAACSATGFLLWRRERFRAEAAVRERDGGPVSAFRQSGVDGRPDRQDDRVGGAAAAAGWTRRAELRNRADAATRTGTAIEARTVPSA